MDDLAMLDKLVAVSNAQDAVVRNLQEQVELVVKLVDSLREGLGIVERRVRNLEDYLLTEKR